MRKKFLSAAACAAIITSVAPLSTSGVSASQATVSAAAVTKLFADVQIDLECDGSPCSTSTIANSNTTRKLAVLSNGTIAASFRADTGIYVATSSDRGKTFGKPVKVTSDSREAELAASAGGVLYVLWNTAEDGGNGTVKFTYKLSTSTDSGTTWSAATTVGTSSRNGVLTPTTSQPAHMAVDGDYIYVLNQSGTDFFRSSDAGATWTAATIGSRRAYSDVQVDTLSGTVYVFTDDPRVRYFVSTDRGATFTAEASTTVDVFFSVGALTATATERYFYMAGSDSNLERITMSNGTVDTKTVEASAGMQTRSLAADACGNVVSGHKTGSDLFFQVSTDSGTTFGAAEKVVEAADRANTAINTTNGDLLYMYEKGNKIYLTTYTGAFSGACYAASLSTTAVEFDAPGDTKDIEIENTSSSPLDISSITISGSAITLKHNCPASLPAGAKCKVTVSAKTSASEVITLIAGGVTKLIPVKMGAIAAAKPEVKPVVDTTTTSGAIDTKLYRRIPKSVGKYTAHTILGPKAARTRAIVSRTPSVCVGLTTSLVAIETGTCRIQIVDRKSRAIISSRTISVKAAYTGTGTQLTNVGTLRFGNVSWTLTKTARAAAKKIAADQKASARLLVIGHAAQLTDATVFNRRISEFRAANVKRSLQSNGYKGAVSMAVLGSNAPLTKVKTEAAQAKNRRVDILAWPSAG